MQILRLLLAFFLILPVPVVVPALVHAAYAPLPISAEDAAHVAGENLMRAGCKRTDTAAASSATDGDWITENCDAVGAKYVNSELPAAVAPTATGMTVPASAPWVLAAMGCYNPVAVTMELCIGASNIAHDASASGISPLLIGGYANAAAPSSVSADLDAVNAWFLRNGAQAMVLTAAGALIGGDATNGLDVDVTRVPTDPFGANADAASATGSISAKLRFIAATGIPVTGTVTVGSHAVTNAGTFAVQSTLQAGSAIAGKFGIDQTTPGTTNLVQISDSSGGAINIICDSGCSGGAQVTQDAAMTIGSAVGTLAMGRASATAPTDVSADNDAVIAWMLRSGATVTQPSFGGVLGVAGNGASGTGVQRVTMANDSTGVLATVSTVTNLSQLGGAAIAMNTGVRSAGTQRVTVATDDLVNVNLTGSAIALDTTNATLELAARVEDAAETDGTRLIMAGLVRRDVAASSAGTTGDNATANVDALGLLWTRTLDPCSGVAKTSIPINIATATTTELTGALAGASTHYYVCSIDLVAAAAQTFALVDDDSDGCGSVTSGLAGGTTAATGWSFAANGGIAKGNGNAMVFKTGGTNRVICAVTGQAAQISGSIQVVAAP